MMILCDDYNDDDNYDFVNDHGTIRIKLKCFCFCHKQAFFWFAKREPQLTAIIFALAFVFVFAFVFTFSFVFVFGIHMEHHHHLALACLWPICLDGKDVQHCGCGTRPRPTQHNQIFGLIQVCIITFVTYIHLTTIYIQMLVTHFSAYHRLQQFTFYKEIMLATNFSLITSADPI